MATTKRNSRIFDEMHEIARGLHAAGLIGERRMGELSALCLVGIEEMSPQQIRQLREQSHISQEVLAAVLNTSLATVQKWEVGERKPSGPCLKLLTLINRKGLEAVL